MSNQSTFEDRPSIEPGWLMPAVDAVLVFVAFIFGYLIRYELQILRPVFDPARAEFLPYMPYAAFFATLLFFTYHSNGLYRNMRGRSWMEETSIIANGVASSTVILLALYFLLQPLVTSRLMLIYVAALTIILLSIARIVRRSAWAYLRAKGIGVQRVVIAGMGDVGQAVLRTLVSRSELGYKVIGYLDDNPQVGEVDLGRVTGLGKLDNLEKAIIAHGVDLIIITLRWREYDRILELTRAARRNGADVRIVPDIFQLNLRQVQFENLDGIPLLGISATNQLDRTSRLLKRLLDVGLTIITAPIWLPVFAMVALAVRMDDGGSILYVQKRVGENGRPLHMLKFRTMVPDADARRQQLIEQFDEDPRHPKFINDPRVTRVGRFLRRTSLDELPNLINVLKGEMSLVGPRPPMPSEVELYENWHMQRLQTTPGITGLWQVSGRSEVPFDEMVLMDIYYIENWSIRYDLQILFMTIPKVLMRRGAY